MPLAEWPASGFNPGVLFVADPRPGSVPFFLAGVAWPPELDAVDLPMVNLGAPLRPPLAIPNCAWPEAWRPAEERDAKALPCVARLWPDGAAAEPSALVKPTGVFKVSPVAGIPVAMLFARLFPFVVGAAEPSLHTPSAWRLDPKLPFPAVQLALLVDGAALGADAPAAAVPAPQLLVPPRDGPHVSCACAACRLRRPAAAIAAKSKVLRHFAPVIRTPPPSPMGSSLLRQSPSGFVPYVPTRAPLTTAAAHSHAHFRPTCTDPRPSAPG